MHKLQFRAKFFGVFLIIVLTGGCMSSTSGGELRSGDAQSELCFVQQDKVAGEREVLEALLYGQLVVTDGCLRVQDESNQSLLLVWPPGYSLDTGGDTVRVINSEGQAVVSVGDRVLISGGEVVQLPVGVVCQCSGPYWLVGDKVEPAEELESQ